MHCADFPRHLGRQITRCLIAHPDGADTIELAHWAYAEVRGMRARTFADIVSRSAELALHRTNILKGTLGGSHG